MAIKTFNSGEVLTASDTNTYLANGGLVFVKQTTTTSGTTADVTSCFSATYNAYRLVVSDLRTAATAAFHFTVLSGTTVAASNWTFQSGRLDYATNAWNLQKGTASANVDNVGVASTNSVGLTIDIFNPYLSQNTSVMAQGTDARGTTGYPVMITNGLLSNTTSYDGLRLTLASSTYSNAVLTVYGYRLG